ncbi:sugar ABC transporter ATP-binding protein [Virgibacillus phasianinus]|uniref:Sugar ABC transporter ATP-binding protein n=1 Tax=Virgibacillus phasianinus TaxID=2017483 RepID=A0A220U3A1_9BACI|nr:sugar ABC transporter ATP-binding protein [Virgibacillus phasianinus]ASK62301.1 sugar ABC transporter ATP-binding protein [Virgibacillus phasianinus]
MSSNLMLKAEGISKSFPGVKALSDVSFNLKGGEIHSLMGENGAGKSTLIKVLTGVHEKNAGTFYLKGKKIEPKSPQEAQKLGISTVYQEINLCGNLTVAENIFIGREPKKNGRIDWKEINKRAGKILSERLNISIDVSKLLSSYSTAIQQMVAIARAVDISSGVLILDEPTSSLDKNEVQKLFEVMRNLKNEGMAIIFVSHFLDQVYEITDRITVLRNGHLIGEYETKKLSKPDLVSKMIGKELGENTSQPKKNSKGLSDELFLDATGFGRRGTISPIDLSLRKGEVLGLAGLLGSGRTEVAKLIFGIENNDQGVLVIDNERIRAMNPRTAIEKGLSFCPEDRKVEGIVNDLTIRENIVLGLQTKKGLFKYIPMKEQKEISQKYIDLLRIKTPSMEQRIDNLSGGNQQKVILARWLATNPKLLILDEPTRGIDVGSKGEIRRLILDLANEGITILFISAELDELVACCDEVVVLRDRKKIGHLEKHEISVSNIMDMIAKGDGLIETNPV